MQSDASRQVILTGYSQSHVLQQRMKEAKLTHGETVTANLSPVRIDHRFGSTIMYFCPMNTIDVVEQLTPGDGLSIPAEAKLENITIPADLKPGLYELKNVKLFSNGTMQVIATENTEFKLVAEDVSHSYASQVQAMVRAQEEMYQRQRERMAELSRARQALASSIWPF